MARITCSVQVCIGDVVKVVIRSGWLGCFSGQPLLLQGCYMAGKVSSDAGMLPVKHLQQPTYAWEGLSNSPASFAVPALPHSLEIV